MCVRWLVVTSGLAFSGGQAEAVIPDQPNVSLGSLRELQTHPCYPTKIVKMPDSINRCNNEANRSLCSVRYKLGFTSEIHSTVSLYGCMDLEGCESKEQFNSILDRLCEVPSCSIFPDDDENSAMGGDRLLCMITQTLLCDSADRFNPTDDLGDKIAVVCQDDAVQGGRRLFADNAVSTNNSVSENEPGPDLAHVGNGSRSLKDDVILLEPDLMTGLIDCGMGYYRDLPSLLFSGTTTSLGSYSSCLSHHNGDEFQYCTVQYDTMLYQGECLPKGCVASTFYNLLNFICGEIGHRDNSSHDHAGHDYTGMETCLDFLDSIPPMLCVSAQLLGCGNTMASVSNQQDILSVITTPRLLPNGDGQRSGQYHSNNVTAHRPASITLTSMSDNIGMYDWSSQMPSMPLHMFESFGTKLQEIIKNYDNLQSLFALKGPLADTPFGDNLFFDSLSATYDGRILLDSSAPHHDDAAMVSTVGMPSWWDYEKDTISLHRYESPAGQRYRVRCGGWTAVLDDSRFNKTVGIIVVLIILILPLYPLHRRFLKGWFTNIRSNIQECSDRANFLGRGDFSHVCGLRSLNMFWVVLGHTFTFSWQEGVDQNFKEALGLVHDYKFQFIISGQLAVDSFFFLAGLMFGLFGSSKLEKVYSSANRSGGATRAIKYAGLLMVKRYLRLVPTMSLILAFSYFVLPYLGSGPMWVPYVDYLRYGIKPDRSGGCYRYWWSVLTLTNNLQGGAEGLQCLGHTWYLSNDFQFYILGNLLVILSCITNRKTMYLTALGVLTVASLYSYHVVRAEHLHFSIPAFSDASITPAQEGGTLELMKNWATFYVKPWCRIGPYLVGLSAGICQRDGWFERQVSLLQPCGPSITTSGDDHVTNDPGSRGEDTRGRMSTAANDELDELVPDESPILYEDRCPTPDRMTSPTRRLLIGRLRRNYLHLDTMDATEDYQPVADRYIITLYTTLCLVGIWACCVSVPYLANKGQTLTWNVTLDQLWFVYNRTLWALCLGWFSLILVYVGSKDKNIIVKNPVLVVLKEILANRAMALCSVYTFTFYLVHPLVEQAYYATRTTDVCLNNLIGWFATISHFCFTGFFGVLTTAMVEFPLGKLFTAIGL